MCGKLGGIDFVVISGILNYHVSQVIAKILIGGSNLMTCKREGGGKNIFGDNYGNKWNRTPSI